MKYLCNNNDLKMIELRRTHRLGLRMLRYLEWLISKFILLKSTNIAFAIKRYNILSQKPLNLQMLSVIL